MGMITLPGDNKDDENSVTMAVLCLSVFYTKRKTLVVFPYEDWAALEPLLAQPLQLE